MFVELEQSRSMAMYATMMAGANDQIAREPALSAAKAQIGQSARRSAVSRSSSMRGRDDDGVPHRALFNRVTMIDSRSAMPTITCVDSPPSAASSVRDMSDDAP
ncbi:hypothetical protein [Bradyrhizobium sp. DASA03007]|uniref:hypothetical protein n=1 Tax=unclassified Bradyrhizobium TaxID=2631580 RepID=UPI003F6E730E